tara:strand:+ start:315 stop:563 length:249 start_codon:yes stop_codon:yes gene_type:complete
LTQQLEHEIIHLEAFPNLFFMTYKIQKHSPHGKTNKGWWIVTTCLGEPAYWGKCALPGHGYRPSVGFDTKEEAIQFAESEGL